MPFPLFVLTDPSSTPSRMLHMSAMSQKIIQVRNMHLCIRNERNLCSLPSLVVGAMKMPPLHRPSRANPALNAGRSAFKLGCLPYTAAKLLFRLPKVPRICAKRPLVASPVPRCPWTTNPKPVVSSYSTGDNRDITSTRSVGILLLTDFFSV